MVPGIDREPRFHVSHWAGDAMGSSVSSLNRRAVSLCLALATVAQCGQAGTGQAPDMITPKVTGDYVAVYLRPEGWRFRLIYRGGRLTRGTAFARSGRVVVNGLYFEEQSGALAGRVRANAETISDDGRRFGTGLVWDDATWRLTDSNEVARYANGFQAGPTLVRNGEIAADWRGERVNPRPTSRARRAGIGRMSSGATVIVVTKRGYTVYGFAQLVTALGAYEAINLDGGASACLFVDGRSYVRPGQAIPAALVVEEYRVSESQMAMASPARRAAPAHDPALPTVTLGAGRVGIVTVPRDEIRESFARGLVPCPAVVVPSGLFNASDGQPLPLPSGTGGWWLLTDRGFRVARGGQLSRQSSRVGGRRAMVRLQARRVA